MSDKNIKLEYQFVGTDNGLSETADNVSKKLEALEQKAKNASKALEKLNKNTKTQSATKSPNTTQKSSTNATKSENQELKNKLNTLKGIESSEKRILSLKRSQQTLRVAKTGTQQELKDTQMAQKITSSYIKELDKKIRKVKDADDAFKKYSKTVDITSKKLAELTKKDNLKEKDLFSFESKLNQLSSIDKKTRDFKALRQELEQLRNTTKKRITLFEKNGMTKEADVLKNKLKELDNAINSASNKANDAGSKYVVFGKRLQEVARQISTLNQGLAKAGTTIQSFGSKISSVGKKLVSTGNSLRAFANSMKTMTYGITAGLAGAIKEGVDVEKSLAGVASTINRMEIDLDTGKIFKMDDSTFQGYMDDIEAEMKRLSAISPFDNKAVADSFRYTALAGWTPQEMLASMETFTKLSTVIGSEDIATDVDKITDSLASLGLAFDKIEFEDGSFEYVKKNSADLASEVERLADVMAKAQSISNMDISQLAESYKKVGGTMATFNVPLETTTALLAVLANRGLKGNVASTGLSTTMLRLTAKTGESAKALDELTKKTGINVKAFNEATGEYVGVETQLENICKAMDMLSEKDRIQLTGMIAGKQHMKTFTKLLEGFRGEYKETKALISNSDGALDEMFDITNQSAWAELKMAVSNVKNALYEAFQSMRPIFTEVLNTITKVAQAFTSLSDEQKKSVLKWLGLIAILPIVLSTLGNIMIVAGSLTNVFGTLTTALGTAVKMFANFVSFLPALGGVLKTIASGGLFTGLATGLSGMFAKVVSVIDDIILNIWVMGETIAGTTLTFAGAFKTIAGTLAVVATKIIIITELFRGLFDFFANFKDLGFLGSLEEAVSNILERLWKGIANIVGLFSKKGKSWINDNITSKMASTADKKAQSEGYKNYSDKKKQEQNILVNLKTKISGNGSGTFNALTEALETGGQITIETVVKDASSYRQLKNNMSSNVNTRKQLEADIKLGEKKVQELNKHIEKDKKRLSELELNPKINKNAIEKMKKHIEQKTSERDAEYELVLANKDEIERLLEEYTKDEEKKITVETIHKENGTDGFLQYESDREDLEKEYGIKLSFVDYDADRQRMQELLENLPGIREQLEAKLKLTNDPTEYNRIYFMLEKVKDFEALIPVYMDLIEEQNTIKKADALIEKLEGEKIEYEVQIKEIEADNLIDGVFDPEKLDKATKTAYDNATAELDRINKDIADNMQKIQDAKEEIGKMDETDLSKITELWDTLYKNYDKPLITLFDEKEVALLQQLLKENNTKDTLNKITGNKDTNNKTSNNSNKTDNSNKKVNFKEDSKSSNKQEQKTSSFSTTTQKLSNTNKQKEEKPKAPVRTQTTAESFKNSYNFLTQGNSATKENTTLTNQNTQAKKENVEATKQQGEAQSEATNKGLDTSNVDSYNEAMQSSVENAENLTEKSEGLFERLKGLFSGGEGEGVGDQVSSGIEGANAEMDTLVGKIDTISQAMSSIDFSTLTGAVSGLQETLESAREKLLSISNVANNLGKESMTGMGQALIESFNGAREAVLSVANVANNYGKSCMTSMGQALSDALITARTDVLNVANVANNYGKNCMTAMGNALTNALSGARTAVLNVANVANNYGKSSMAGMGNALVSTVSNAKSIVASIASQISSIGSQIETLKQKASSIKLPTLSSSNSGEQGGMRAIQSLMPVQVLATPSLVSQSAGFRSIGGNTTNNSIANTTSNFNFNVKGALGGDRQSIKQTARQLTTYCKRRGL